MEPQGTGRKFFERNSPLAYFEQLYGQGFRNLYSNESLFTAEPFAMLFTLQQTISAGSCFGETEIELKRLRKYTVVAWDNCSLIQVSRVHYMKILGIREDNQSTIDMFSFLSEIIFSDLRGTAISTVCHAFSATQFQFGARLFGQDQEVNKVFVVRRGELAVDFF